MADITTHLVNDEVVVLDADSRGKYAMWSLMQLAEPGHWTVVTQGAVGSYSPEDMDVRRVFQLLVEQEERQVQTTLAEGQYMVIRKNPYGDQPTDSYAVQIGERQVTERSFDYAE